MDESWTLTDLVAEVVARLARLPAPKNGQVRAVPDERGLRYYATIGLLDRPHTMRGRTALYGRRHLAQVIAVKRLQQSGRSLAEIQALWPTLDDAGLQRMSGVEVSPVAVAQRPSARPVFWKKAPDTETHTDADADAEQAPTIQIEIARGVMLTLAIPNHGISLTPADVRALRAAAAPLVAELDTRRLTPGENEP